MPAPRRTAPGSIPLWGLAIVALLLLTPAASAELLVDEGSNSATFDLQSVSGGKAGDIKGFRMYRIQDWDGLYFVYVKSSNIGNPSILTANPSYDMDVTLKIGSDVVGTGTAHYNALYNSAGSITGVQVWLDIDTWNSTGYIGTQWVTITPSSGTLFNGLQLLDADGNNPSPTRPIGFYNTASASYLIKGMHLSRSHYYWQNDIQISDEFVSLTRQLDGNEYISTLQITSDLGYITDTSPNNVDLPYIGTGTWNVTNPYGRIFEGILGSDTSNGATVNVYVRNSQTGALLAGSHVTISASVGGEFYEVVNQTLPSGIYNGPLQPTGGGLPNPDYYRLTATADGYNPYMPYIDFELDRPTTLIVEMEPTTGGPADENKTFIEFYVRDLNTNPISGATVTCGGYSLLTNSAGFTQFELPVNASYPYTVSKSNYITIEGTATVADDPRYTVNVVLGQGEIPTLTPTPTAPGATPTPDRRTNEEKGQAVIDMIADNAEGIGALALICLIMGLLKLLAKW